MLTWCLFRVLVISLFLNSSTLQGSCVSLRERHKENLLHAWAAKDKQVKKMQQKWARFGSRFAHLKANLIGPIFCSQMHTSSLLKAELGRIKFFPYGKISAQLAEGFAGESSDLLENTLHFRFSLECAV